MSEGGRTTANLPGLAYREAHTPYAAAETVDYLISAFGLRHARDLSSEPGRIVLVYRPAEPNPKSEAGSFDLEEPLAVASQHRAVA